MNNWREEPIGSALRGGRPGWLYPPARWQDPATTLGPDHDRLRPAITANLLAASGISVTP